MYFYTFSSLFPSWSAILFCHLIRFLIDLKTFFIILKLVVLIDTAYQQMPQEWSCTVLFQTDMASTVHHLIDDLLHRNANYDEQIFKRYYNHS